MAANGAREGGMGIMPWSPLAGGFLSGKYRRADTSGTGRLSGANPFGDSKFTDRNWDFLDTMQRPGITAPLIRRMVIGDHDVAG